MIDAKDEFCRVYEAASRFLEWMEHYENWVDENYGCDYREQCFREYHRKWLPPKQAKEWFRLYRNSPELLGSWSSRLKFSFAGV